LKEIEDGEETEEAEELISERIVLHSFPSKICSVSASHSTSVSGRIHSGPWVCIRCVSSTVFASIEVSSKKEQLLGYPPYRLVLMLEILHGDSVLSSGVSSNRAMSNQDFGGEDNVRKSLLPIVDAQFHPDRCTTALTIDSRGNVGCFECDLLTVRETTWENGVSWHAKGSKTTEERQQESRWMLQFTEDDDTVVVANSSEVQLLSLQRGDRKTVYSCTDAASIVGITRSSLPSPLLWIATTREVLLFNLQSDFELQQLLSWQHHRSYASQLQIRSLYNRTAGAVVLSNKLDRMLSVFSAAVDISTGQAKTVGEPSFLATSLLHGNAYACGPAFTPVASLHPVWHSWINRNSKSKDSVHEGDQLMIEKGRDGGIYIKAVAWNDCTSTERMRPACPASKVHASSRSLNPDFTGSHMITERSVHSLSPVYQVLMGDLSSRDHCALNEAISALSQARRWLQEQDVPMETMMLPLDLLALCCENDGPASSLLRLPLLPMSIAVDTGVQRLLTGFLSSTQRDAWTASSPTSSP
jgi:hypothetical protein